MKCKKQIIIKEPSGFTMEKNKMYAIKGFCPDCNTKVCRIIGKAKPEEPEDLE